MSETLLQIQDLEISLGEKKLVKGVSFEIPRKTVIGLVGESGSGKTLTALSILGLLPPGITASNGSILLDSVANGSNLLAMDERKLNQVRGNRISMIFQEPMTSLNPSMKCGQQVMETLLKKSGMKTMEARAKVLSLFADVRLPDAKRIFSSWPHELSGGQRQRVMISMALAASPDLLIADEPTTALDVTVQKSILELLADLKEKYELSILFITHDLMVLKQIADEIAVMYRGELLEKGKAQEILENPSKDYTKGLIACKPGLDKKPYRLPTVADFMLGRQPSKKPSSQKTNEKKASAILKVKDLEVEYRNRKKSVKAVKSVSFEVFKGETLGLVGESGCGKSTLGRSILQLVEAKSGNIEYRGIALNKLKAKDLRRMRKNIQIVFQDPYSSLNPGKTIGNMLAEPLKIHGLAKGKESIRKRTEELLELVGLEKDALQLFPHQFSGGQRQRIGIARALACEPEFIVFDESVSALDVSVQAQILNLLNDLKERYDLTYIFISHDLTVVKYMSERILVMSSGEIVESGDSSKIYLNPANDYTRMLINSIPG